MKVEPVPSRWLDDTRLLKDEHAAETVDRLRDREEFDPLPGNHLHVYRCESLLGRGGMGRVYLALHTHLHRRYALKILSPRLAAGDLDYVARFQQEGRVAASLIHPNIVTIHAIGHAPAPSLPSASPHTPLPQGEGLGVRAEKGGGGEERGFHFLEMEFVAGPSLQQVIREEGRLTPVRAMSLALRMAEGLSAAHRSGIIHRDLKPDNVLMTPTGQPKLADFGLAKRVVDPHDSPLPWGEGPGVRGGHRSRYLLGTPYFMAPELFQGRPAGPAGDVYALGVCCYLMLSGSFPFTGRSLAQLKQAVTTQPLPNIRDAVPEVTLEMAECLSLLLAKSPQNRTRDGIEAAQLLRAVLGYVRDLESLLREAFQDMPEVAWTRSGQRYRLNLTLPDGRRQTLFIEPSDHPPAERLLLFYSICCDAEPDYYEQALKLNSEIPHGGLALREIDGQQKFVVVNTYPRATVDPEEIRLSALEVASRADAVENLLTGLDRH